jgi:hypothetical protein
MARSSKVTTLRGEGTRLTMLVHDIACSDSVQDRSFEKLLMQIALSPSGAHDSRQFSEKVVAASQEKSGPDGDSQENNALEAQYLAFQQNPSHYS